MTREITELLLLMVVAGIAMVFAVLYAPPGVILLVGALTVTAAALLGRRHNRTGRSRR